MSGIFKRKKKEEGTSVKTAYSPSRDNKPVAMKVLDPVAGPGTRIWAFFGDVSLTQALYMIFGNHPMLTDVANELFRILVELITPFLPPEEWINSIQKDLEKFFPFIVLFYSLRIVSVLLTGVSPGQFCMGLKSHSNILWARVGGLLRTLIEVITMPLLIFDLTALFSRRTLKEFITFTGLSVRNGFFRFMGAVILVPSIFAFTFISPMFNELHYFETGIPYEELSIKVKKNKKNKKNRKNKEEVAAKTEAPPIEAKEGEAKGDTTKVAEVKTEEIKTEEKKSEPENEENDEAKLKEYSIQSELFRFNTTMPKKDELILIPDLVIENVVDAKGKKKLIFPAMKIAHKDLKSYGEFRVFKLFDLNGLYKIFEEGNPLAFFFYPNLSKWSSNKDVPTLKHNPNEGKFTVNQMTELEMILEKSLKLNINVVHDYALEQGPFIKGMVDVRKTLSELIEVDTLTQAMVLKIAKNTILILKGEAENTHFLIPVSFSYGIIYQVNWKAGKDQDALMKEFYGDLFRDIEGRDKVQSVRYFGEEGNVFAYQSPFAILDLFHSKKIKESEREIVNQYFFNYFYEIAGKVLKTDEKMNIDLVQKSLKHFDDLIVYQKNDSSSLQQKLKADIATLQKALADKDRSYFGLDLPEGVTPVPPAPTPIATPVPTATPVVTPAPNSKSKKKG
jgi:hypothetical protein